MHKRSILIGSNGYLGRHLATELERQQFDNRNFDLALNPPEGINHYQSFDLTDPKSFDLLNPEVDFIFLFAGVTGTAQGFEDHKKYIRVNEAGLLNLLDWMRKSKCRARLVFPSTRLVYQGQKNTALKEDAPKEAKTIYALNKLSAEHLLWMYHNAFDIEYTIFRICVPYGNRFDEDYSYGTVGFFLSKAMKGENISLYGDGSIRRTFTHVDDITRIITGAIQKEETKNNVFNIGGENLSLREAAAMIASRYKVEIDFTDWPDLALRLESGDTVFDDGKLRNILQICFDHTLKSWIRGIRF
ncbi:MAG: NAD-dependent epimerase/dehydratase family protein [Bacteroidales bacterium]